MIEQRIKYETAILAKEKGFKQFSSKNEVEGSYYWYDKEGILCNSYYVNGFGSTADGMTNTYAIFSKSCEAPTQSLLQKWLREKKLINITVDYNYCEEVKGKYGFLEESFFQCIITDLRNNDIITDVSGFGSKTYEEALEIGLQDALKLIKKKT